MTREGPRTLYSAQRRKLFWSREFGPTTEDKRGGRRIHGMFNGSAAVNSSADMFLIAAEDDLAPEFEDRAEEAQTPDEYRILAAVLWQSWLDAVEPMPEAKGRGTTKNAIAQAKHRRVCAELTRNDAEAWFASQDESHCFAFIPICDVLNLDADKIRGALARAVSARDHYEHQRQGEAA